MSEGGGIRVVTPGPEKSVWIFDELMDFKATGEDTRGAFALWLDTPLPGYSPPLHIHHREDEAFVILEGEFVFRGTDGELEAGPGAFVYVPRGTPHTFKNVGAEPGKMVVVTVPAGIESFFLGAGQPATDRERPPAPDVDRIMELASRYGTEVIEEGP